MTTTGESLTDDELVAIMAAIDSYLDRTRKHLDDGQASPAQRERLAKHLALLSTVAAKLDQAADVIVTPLPGAIIL